MFLKISTPYRLGKDYQKNHLHGIYINKTHPNGAKWFETWKNQYNFFFEYLWGIKSLFSTEGAHGWYSFIVNSWGGKILFSESFPYCDVPHKPQKLICVTNDRFFWDKIPNSKYDKEICKIYFSWSFLNHSLLALVLQPTER